IYNCPTSRDLLQRLHSDGQLRQICGWKRVEDLPHESTFSRAFAEFAEMELPQFVHAALIRDTQKDRLVGHIARDSTATLAYVNVSKPVNDSRKPLPNPRRPTPPSTLLSLP